MSRSIFCPRHRLYSHVCEYTLRDLWKRVLLFTPTVFGRWRSRDSRVVVVNKQTSRLYVKYMKWIIVIIIDQPHDVLSFVVASLFTADAPPRSFSWDNSFLKRLYFFASYESTGLCRDSADRNVTLPSVVFNVSPDQVFHDYCIYVPSAAE